MTRRGRGCSSESAVQGENGWATGAYHVRNPEKPSRMERETAVSA
ncbi:hypothetical protein [Nonomuraea angiospora]|nr:hypothetical protein [Nonomuraea angiospora]MDX3108832.1 hypothetical protein [Nonomuraea angiospora]